MKKILSLILAAFLCICAYNPYVYADGKRPDNSELYSLSAAMIDGDTGRVLYEKNGSDVRAMASTTKIMTLILALEYGNDEDVVTVSSYAAKMPDVQLGICEGEQYYMRDLIYSMMLESHNDSAVAIAEHVGGDVSRFADMMNQKAREIGLSHTYFITPNGLDAKDEKGTHSTTAIELALIMKYCIMDSPAADKFIAVCQTRDYSFSDYEGKRHFSVHNKNRFLDMMQGVIAGKTGFTADAGYCYVAALDRDGKTYIIALLGCGWPGNKGYKWADSKKLLEYGIVAYDKAVIINDDYKTGDIDVLNGISGDCTGTYIKDEDISLLICGDDTVEIRENIPESIEAPISSGDIVGSVYIYVNGELYDSLNVYAAKSINRVSFIYYMKCVISDFLL